MVSGKAKYSHGDILQVELDFNSQVFAFCKYIDLRNWNIKSHAYQLLLIYDYFSKKPLTDIKDIKSRELLCNPIRFFGSNALPQNWSRIGREAVVDSESIFMDLKSSWPNNVNNKEDLKTVNWFVSSMLNPDNSQSCKYDEIRHLEPSSVIYIEKISFRIYLEYLKLQEIDIHDFDEIYREVYINSVDIPALKDIPMNFRYRICPNGISKYVANLPNYKSYTLLNK
jgi:hypothetical protein